MKRIESWGRYPKTTPKAVERISWRHETPNLARYDATVLPYAYGRSYGDSCLNDDGIILDVTGMRHFLAFDDKKGIIRCEAGVSLAEVNKMTVPRGWFLPVTPGTKFVSVAGAIANDVHGKNHHKAGTFGCHVTRLELLRSNGERIICSPTQNAELFAATIGGLGLTGLILWAEFTLTRVNNAFIANERIRFHNLEEFFDLSARSTEYFDYTVGWIDILATGDRLGRGIFIRGNHAAAAEDIPSKGKGNLQIPVPIDLPSQLLNRFTVGLFNEAYYRVQPVERAPKVIHYEPFFYPLDTLTDWYRLYGKQGFLQYQLVVPYKHDRKPIRDIITRIARSGAASPLLVFKTFGTRPSPGMLSFPREGVTLALDFPFRGAPTLKLLEELDTIVRAAGGAIYPAKDARMSPETFEASYPNWREFARHVDPKFSSSFWRRVTCAV
jgi:FAD/FMN-containing dehydrogenase